MIPSPSDVEYFAEVARTLNFSRAAERLGVTQPALSLSMKRLEDLIGVRLFHRDRTGVRLTKSGHKFLAQSRLLIEYWKNLSDDIKRDQFQVSGKYSLGCHPSVGLYALPLFLPKLLASWPELELTLYHDLSRKITEQVISFKIDLGIVVNPVSHPDLVIVELCKDEVTLWQVASSNSDVLIYDPDLAQAQSIVAGLDKSKIKFQRQMHSSSLEVIASLAAAGTGVAILPGRVAARSGGRLVEFGRKAPRVLDRVCLIYRSESKGVAMEAIMSAVKQIFVYP